MRWSDFERDAPRLAAIVHERLIAPGVLLVGTVRTDGTPRISPVEPLLMDGDLFLSMLWRSHKALDLLRDDRILLHSIVTSREGAHGEVKIRGHAVAVGDLDVRARYCDAVEPLGWRPEEPTFHLFRIEIGDVSFIRYAEPGDQHVTRFPTAQEYVRPATSDTSVGPPRPAAEFL